MRNYIRITSVLLPESAGDNAQLNESQGLVQRQGRLVVRHHRVELQYPESKLPAPVQAVRHEQRTDVLSTHIRAHRVACVGDMSAAPDVVRVEYVQPHRLAVVHGNASEALGGEEFPRVVRRQVLFLGICLPGDNYHQPQSQKNIK